MKSPAKSAFEVILAISVLFAMLVLPLAAKAGSHMQHQPPPFSEFDQDGDGFVTEEEFDAYRAARHEAMAKEGRPMKGRAGAPAFSDIDTDGDGRLTEAELTAAHEAHRKAMHEEHSGKGMHHGRHDGGMMRFEDIDKDGDGCISPAEFDAHHAEMHPQ